MLLVGATQPNKQIVQKERQQHTAIRKLESLRVARRLSVDAAREGHVDVAQLLLPVIPQHILEVMDYQDYTPLRAARANGHGKVVALIQERTQQLTLPAKL